jgi:indolepyruvate ferredoxin oxidoreductase
MSVQTLTLIDKYVQEQGSVYLTGIQALVRLPLEQRRRDRQAQLNTGGFISGYRGSPLAGYDRALWGAKDLLEAENIHFQPGINEDLAATAVWGSQQVGLFPGATVDGAFGIWYAKAPGVDRSMDALKHANSAGTSRYGGVLAILGDDHGGVSSTLVSQSDQMMIAAMMPVLNPASVREYIEFGLLGIALSRFSGCWVGFKAISDTVESSASVLVSNRPLEIQVPSGFQAPADGLHIRWPDFPQAQEIRLRGPKMDAVAAFARANALDRTVWHSKRPRFGIVTSGKAYTDVLAALAELGLDRSRADDLGLTIYKVGLSWPLEASCALAFSRGLEDVLVVEEKSPLIEEQLVKVLYNLPQRPRVVGKTDERGRPLLPSAGTLDARSVARAIATRLLMHIDDAPLRSALDRLSGRRPAEAEGPAVPARIPYFCSGCPHNSSTKLPDGSRAGAGIGCHGMASFLPVMRTTAPTHMGGEGANWIGQAPFTTEAHFFQNLGDGTYYHSGLLAIRAAAAAGVNITYKILFNDAVAMTGGQPHDGPITVQSISVQVAAEGARKIYVVSDEPEKYGRDPGFAPGTIVRHRDDLEAVQRELRETRGLTVLIYDQACAAEKRRKRKRGLYPDPPVRAFINHLVCEACGDCSVKSNCVSIKPLETEFGRKRRIDQSDCNKDFSCVNGFCPSFVTLEGGAVRKMARAGHDAGVELIAQLPTPSLPSLHEPYNILVTGIGGTGVLTISALIGMAAHIDDKGCTVLDNTGLAQKNGAVMSHIRLAGSPDQLDTVRVGSGKADLLIGCDMLVSAGAAALESVAPGRTAAVVNDHLQPTADFIRDNDMDLPTVELLRRITSQARDPAHFVNATGLATALMGDSIATNLFMLGFAWQKGLVPLSIEALERAIELNGVAVDANKRTLAWGRAAAHDPERVARAAQAMMPASTPALTTEELIRHRRSELEAYQSAAYADRYQQLVDRAAAADARAGGDGAFTSAVASGLYKLMAYKDEYEVARLHTDERFRRHLESQFEPGFRLKVHLAPPLFAKRDPATGELRKRAFGPWMMKAFRLLRHGKSLRGTWADPFGYTSERRTERGLIVEYETLIREVSAELSGKTYAIAVELADVAQLVRGFGHIKERNVARAREQLAALQEQYRLAGEQPAAKSGGAPSRRPAEVEA